MIALYGAAAVFGGRPATASEIRAINIARRVADAHAGRAAAENWAEWSAKNRDASALLMRAEFEYEAQHPDA